MMLFLVCVNAILLGLLVASLRLYSEVKAELDAEWGPWSEIMSIKYPPRVDLHGDKVSGWTYYYQERYHKRTNRYQTRRVL